MMIPTRGFGFWAINYPANLYPPGREAVESRLGMACDRKRHASLSPGERSGVRASVHAATMKKCARPGQGRGVISRQCFRRFSTVRAVTHWNLSNRRARLPRRAQASVSLPEQGAAWA